MEFTSLNSAALHSLMADILLLVHALYILFVVMGYFLIITGIRLKWRWVNYFWFRVIHLSAIIIVVLMPLTGRYCPLTLWENRLRAAAGATTYSGGFIQHWLHQLIYFDLPLWVFSIIYIIFALLVGWTWITHPPRQGRPLRPATPQAQSPSTSPR